MRNQSEIDEEIFALKALKPVGMFRRQTQKKIDLTIEELEDGVDDTAGEWSELSDDEQATVHDARCWKNSGGEGRPSDGWGTLVEPRQFTRRASQSRSEDAPPPASDPK
jgi:hypothetical protein